MIADRTRSAAGFVLTCAPFAAIHRNRFPELFDPWRVGHDDARQWVGPLWIHHDPALLDGDHMTGYMRALTPDGYEWLYLIFSRLDPLLFTKLLSLVLLPLTLLLMHLAVVRVSRSVLAGAAAVALALVFWDLPTDTAGGLPRSFAPPLLAACAWALVSDRQWLLAALPVLSGLLYPPMALVTGGVLTLRCLGWDGGSPAGILRRRPDRKQLAMLGLAGALTLLVVVPSVLEAGRYGPRIDSTSQADREAFPEHVGRYPPPRWHQTASVAVFEDFFRAYWLPRLSAVTGTALPAWWIGAPVGLLLWAGVGGVLLRAVRARPLLLLAVSSGAVCGLAILSYPHLYYPSRYLHMPMMLLMVIALPLIPAAAVAADGRRHPGLARRLGPGLLHLGVVGLAVAASATQGLGRPVGLTTIVREPWRQTYQVLQTLPADALIAGWGRAADAVVLVTGRRVLIGEVDLYHRGHVLEVRRRVRALIEASFSPRHQALLDLRDAFGVTHLVIDRTHVFEDAPSIFEPYQTWVRRRWAQVRDSGAEPAAVKCRTDAAAAVHDDGRFFILDLRAVPDDGCRGRDGRP